MLPGMSLLMSLCWAVFAYRDHVAAVSLLHHPVEKLAATGMELLYSQLCSQDSAHGQLCSWGPFKASCAHGPLLMDSCAHRTLFTASCVQAQTYVSFRHCPMVPCGHLQKHLGGEAPGGPLAVPCLYLPIQEAALPLSLALPLGKWQP